MTCEECEQVLLDSGNWGSSKGWMPGISVLNLAKSHAQNCSACAAKMSDIDKMNDALNQLRVSTLHSGAPATVEMNLLAVFREQTRMPAPSVATAFPRRLVWGSAAALLSVAAVLYLTLNPRVPVTRTIATETERRSGEEHRSKVQLPAVSSGVMTHRRIVESNPPRTGRMAAASGSAIAKLNKPGQARISRPLSQPVGDDLSLNGGGNIVRVTLPLSSLVAMGVPVQPDMSDRRVTADVTMDPFGAVIAIHLVEGKLAIN